MTPPQKRDQMTDPRLLTPAEADELLATRTLLDLSELASVLGHSVGSIRVSRWRGTLGIEAHKVAGRWHVASADVRRLIDPRQKESA